VLRGRLPMGDRRDARRPRARRQDRDVGGGTGDEDVRGEPREGESRDLMSIDFNLPELGENVTSGDVLRVLVKPGDTIAKDQSVVELETDKATIEVPSSVAGQVKDVKVKPGDKVKVGQTILSVDDGAQVPPKPAQAKSEPAKADAPAKADEPAKADAKAEAKAEAPAKGNAKPAPGPASAPDEDDEEERATARPQSDGGKVVDMS